MSTLKHLFSATAVTVLLVPSAQALDIGVGVGIGGTSGVGVGAGVSTHDGIGAGVGASVGGGSGVSAGTGVSVGGSTGPGVGVGVGVGVGDTATGPNPTNPTTNPTTPGTPTNPGVTPTAVSPSTADAMTTKKLNIQQLIGTPVWTRDRVLVGMVEQVSQGPAGKVDTVIRLNAALSLSKPTVKLRLAPASYSGSALRLGYTRAQFLELFNV